MKKRLDYIIDLCFDACANGCAKKHFGTYQRNSLIKKPKGEMDFMRGKKMKGKTGGRRFFAWLAVFAMALSLIGVVPSKKVVYAENYTTFTLYYQYNGEETLIVDIWNHSGLEFTDEDVKDDYFAWSKNQGEMLDVETDSEWRYISFNIVSDTADDGFDIYAGNSSNKIASYDSQWNNQDDYGTLISGSSEAYFITKTGDLYDNATEAGINLGDDPAVFEEQDGYSWVKTDIIPNGDFESVEKDGNTITGIEEWATNGTIAEAYTNNDTNVLSIWLSDSEPAPFFADQLVALTPGWYRIKLDQEGAAAKSGLSIDIEGILSYELPATTGWGNWTTVESDPFYISAEDSYELDIEGALAAGTWGHLDNVAIYRYEEQTEAPRVFEFDTTISTGDPIASDLVAEKIDIMNDFMTGADISSFGAIINSGAEFKAADGTPLTEAGFFELLADSGVNWARIRVWVDPFDSKEKGYGGGNNDVAMAIRLGRLATDAGMRVLIDFHYSDFWTDPGKQMVPKAWAEYTLDEKAEALQAWTEESLTSIIEAGVDVGMVQIGNETTNSFCGESNRANMCKLFEAGSKGVRAVEEATEKQILIAIHLTNPERQTFSSFAASLETNGVTYDVFATSYYPYWHGTLENLQSELQKIATNYGKYVMVAETSYVNTIEDGDGHANTVRKGTNDSNLPYAIGEQGQVTHIKNVVKAVAGIEDNKGIGVFWWEPAWIPVQNWAAAEDKDAVLDENKALWEEYGSGWASSYAGEYDPNDAGKWYGGSAVDNQAWFDFDGKALESVKVFDLVRYGSTAEDYVEEIKEASASVVEGEDLVMPEKVTAAYASGKEEEVDVTWDAEMISFCLEQGPGEFTINGKVTIGEADYDAVCKLTVNPKNLLTNGSFEDGETGWNITRTNANDKVTDKDDKHEGTHTFHFYNGSAQSFTVQQTVTLDKGVYDFTGYFQGLADVTGNIFVKIGDDETTEGYTLADWANWQNPKIENIVVPADETEVTVGFTCEYAGGAWGTCDDFYLYKTGDALEVTFDAGDYGVAPESIFTAPGEKITLPETVESNDDEYVFDGWYTDEDCLEAFDPETAIEEDTVLYAGWATKPVITKSPSDAKVIRGSNGVFRVVATGRNLKYKWQVSLDGGNTWKTSGADGCTTDKITIRATDTLNGRWFRCLVSNAAGTVNSASVVLTTVAVISSQPQNASAAINDIAMFTIKSRSSVATYQWQVSTNGGEKWVNSGAEGNTTTTLSVTAKSAKYNGYMFRCKVTNGKWVEYSNAVTLSIKTKIVKQPVDVTVEYGKLAKLYTKATGVDPQYQWQMLNAKGKWVNSTAAGNQESILRFTVTASFADGKKYRCKITDGDRTIYSNIVTVTGVAEGAE